MATIVSNPALDRFLKSQGVDCVRSGVGERYVIEEMKRHGANVGGEESGHMVLSDYARTGDAMIAALVVSQGLLESGKKMSEIFPLFVPMYKNGSIPVLPAGRKCWPLSNCRRLRRRLPKAKEKLKARAGFWSGLPALSRRFRFGSGETTQRWLTRSTAKYPQCWQRLPGTNPLRLCRKVEAGLNICLLYLPKVNII